MNDVQQPKSGIDTDIDSDISRARSDNSMLNEGLSVEKIAALFAWIKNFFDYLSASCEEPPPGASFLASPLWLGIWWGLMIGLILLFCGQTSKFIYIDF